MRITRVVGISLALAATYGALRVYGSTRWDRSTRELRDRLHAARRPPRPPTVTFAELTPLPAPVQRYLRKVLEDGQPMIAAARVRHTGRFNQSATVEQWKPFTSDQQVVTRRPGFDWNASIAMMPGVPVRVHDAYIAGEGVLRASVLGLLTVANMRDRRETARGELMRFVAEAPWYPTALLPSQGMHWEAVDDRSARGTLTDDSIQVTLLFTFDDQDLVEGVRADARGRTVGNEVVPTPWQGRVWNYQKRQGMLVPLDGEVTWLLPEGPKPYWRGHIEELTYELADR